MKTLSLFSQPISFYAWFLTPLLTFLVFLALSLTKMDNALLLLLLSPLVGCIGLAVWLSKATPFPNGLFCLMLEFYRFLYIFIVGIIFLLLQPLLPDRATITVSNPSPPDILFATLAFLVPSLFFYLIPDVMVAASSFLLRKTSPHIHRPTLIIGASIIGMIALYLGCQLMFRIFLK